MDDLVASGRIGTAREVRKQMSCILNWAADREIIESNPRSGMKRTDLAPNTAAGRARTNIAPSRRKLRPLDLRASL